MLGLTATWQVGQPLMATTFYWDTDGNVAGNVAATGAGLGGSGAWNTAAANWWDTAALTTWLNSSSDEAVFSGAYLPGVQTLNAVTLSGGITANRVSFNRSGYTLSGSTLTLAGTTPGLYAQFGESATIDSVIDGTGGLLKMGGGSIRLNGANTYSGPTVIGGGSLIINNAASLGGTGTVNITAGNGTSSNALVLGLTGGSLVLDGTAGGFTFARNLNIEGRGPSGQNGAALLSIGNNTVSGQINAAFSTQTPVTVRNTRINSVNGTLTLSGGLNAAATALVTTVTTLGGGNTTGIGNFILNGPLSGLGLLEKTGSGTLFLNPSSASGFTGTLRMNASAASGQSTVRISTPLVLGTNVGTGANSVIDLNTGFLEVRMNAPSLQAGASPAAANVYSRNSTNSNFYVGHATGSSLVNETLSLGQFGYAAGALTTFISRDGYGITFGTAPVVTGDNNNTITNNLTGNLTFTGNFWSNSNTAAARTMTIAGSGNTVINGNIIAAGGASFDHVLTKQGAGSLTITGVATTLDGNVNVQGGAVRVTDFRSLNMHTAGTNTGALVLGNATTTGGNLIIGTGTAATAAGLTSNKPITLNTTSAANSIYANQAGTNPVILNGAITKRSDATTGALILGGTNTADNIVNVVIPVETTPSTGGLTKIGAGTWVLNNANTYRGATTVQNGILKLRATAGASDVIGSLASNTVVFSAEGTTQSAGGALEFKGFLNTATTEELGVLTPTAGAARIVTEANGTGTAALNFSSLGTRGAGATINYAPGASTTIGYTTTLPVVTNGIIAAASGGAAFQTYNGVDWAALSGSNVAQYTGYTALPASFSGAGGAAINYSMSADSAATAAASINTLKITGAVANPTLTITGTQTITAKGILFDNSNGTATITNSGTAQLGAANVETVFITNGSSSGNGGVAGVPVTLGNALTVNALIGSGTGSLTKSGAGTLIVGGNNTFTGNVILNEGILQMSGATATLGVNSTAGNLTTVRQGATLDINAAGVSQTIGVGALVGAGVITNSGGGTGAAGTIALGRSTSTGTTIFSGIMQDGAGVLNVAVDGTTARTQAFLGQSTYTGVTTIATGAQLTVNTLADGGVASGIGAATNAAANLVFNGAAPTLIYQGNIREGSLNLGTASAATGRLFTISGSGAVLSSIVANNNAIVWTNTGAIAHGTNANRTLTLTGTSQGENALFPQITNSTGFATSVTKTGTGIWMLRAANNTYSGPTLINQGILGATNGEGLSSNSNLQFDGGTLYSQGNFTRNIGTAAGEMQFLAPAANTAQFSGGFIGGDSKLTVNWSGTPIWDTTAGFLSERDGLMLNGSQARNQGATGSIALSEVDIAGNFSLGTAGGTTLGPAHSYTLAQNSATVSVASTAGLQVGQSITGTNVPSGAYIVSILSATQFQMSANTANAGGIAGSYTDGAITGGNLRAIRVDDNTNTGADFATISGIISAGDTITGIRKLGTGLLRLTGANTYGGETNINQGTLIVSSLGFSGSVGTSSVGAVTVAAFDNSNAITIGNGGTGAGILQYVGPGEVSDRKIRLNTTTGSDQIHADGSGPLVLTNVANDMVAGAKTLFLRGTNNAGNMITSQLSDNGGALGITIDSNATWILTNSINNYSGTTTVSSGALGIGHDTAIGGPILNSNGNIFAYGADRTISNTLTLNNNANWGFLGDYNLTFSNAVLGSSANSNVLINSIVAGKALTFSGLVANGLTATRNFTVDGPGETIINGNFTTSTAFGVQIIKTGNGTLTLGGDGTVSNWNQVGTGIDMDRGTLKFISNNAINSTAGFAGLTFSPELVDNDAATLDLNGTTQTINAVTATTDGTTIIDNTSSTAATFRFGANNSTVNFGSGTGTYTIQNTGSGALSLVKMGNTTANFVTGITLPHKGITASEGGGVFNIASPLTATTGLRATEASSLALTGGLTNPNLITSIEVGGGSTLGLLDGAGSKISNLTSLSLGNTGTGTVALNLNIGDITLGDKLNTDTLTLLTGGTLNLGNTITFNMTDAGLNANQTYTLLNLVDGGLTGFGLSNIIQGATPGGFDSFTWSVTNNLVQITTGNLLLNDLYWRGATDTTWNTALNNWSNDKAGTVVASSIPGQGNKVIFAYNGVGAAALTTELGQNFKINSLVFESGTTTPASVTINPGALTPNARLEIAPNSSASGITISAGGPAAVTIASAFKLGASQTWDIADATTTLTLSGALQGEADVTKTGSGRVILSAAADPSFNSGVTTDVTVSGGNLEMTNLGALGTVANSNVARINVSSGGFYYNNATAGTVVNALTLSGGSLSAGGNNHIYSGAVNISSASTINLADSNGPGTNAARNITLSGLVSGTGALTIDGNNTAANGNQIGGTFTISNAGSTWSGDLLFNRGTATVAAAASPTVTPNNVTFNSFGRLILQGVDGQTLNRSGSLNYAAGAVGEFQVDNTTATQVTDFVVNQNGAVTLGAGGVGASVRVALPDAFAKMNIAGAVTLGGNSSISVSNAATRLLTISGIINDAGNGYGLTINDDAGGWGQTNGIVRLTGLNTFTGNVSLTDGVLEFDTVTNISGGASALGNGTGITLNGGILRYIGSSAQSTNRPITTTAAATLSANGATAADTITYNGAITVGPTADGTQFTLTGIAGREGIITGGITQTGDAAEMVVSGGTWTHLTGNSRVGDGLTVTGADTILNLNSGLFLVRNDLFVISGGKLNLNGTGVLSFNTPTLSADASLRAYTDGVINLGANDAIVSTEFDGLRIGTDGAGVGTLNMSTFNQTVNEFILGNRNLDRSGLVNGTGVLTVTGNLDLYGGTVNANLASTGTTVFEKISMNTVTLTGDNSGLASTGASIIYEGSLILDYTTSNTTKLRAASQLDMRGSNLTLIGNAAAATSQSVGSFTLGSGGNSIITLTPAGQDLVLNLNAITRAVNAQDGSIRFVLPSGTQSATNGITTDTLNTVGTGTASILGGWATVNDGTGVFFARNLTNAADGNIVAAVTTSQDAVGSWVSGDNISDVSGFTGALSGSYINSLRLNAASGSDLSLGASGVLGLNSGGILVTNNVAGTPSITGGTLFSGAVAATPELIITQDSAAVFELGADIRVNHQVFKTGSGTLRLTGNNVYSGLTEIQNGTLQVSGGNAIGDTSIVTLSASRESTLELLADETIGRLAGGSRNTGQDLGTVAIGSNTLTINQSASTTFSGLFTGTGAIVMNTGSTGNLNMTNVSSGFTGSVVINGGLFQLSGIGQNNASSFTVNKSGALLIDNNGTTRSGTRILDTSSIILNSADGTFSGDAVIRGLSIRINQNAGTSETIGNLVFNSGASYVTGEASGTTGNGQIITSNFIRNNNATVMTRGRALGATTGDRNQFRISDATNQTAFIATMVGASGAAASPTLSIVPWAIGESISTAAAAATNMGNTLVTYVSGAGFRPLDLTTEYATFATAGDTNNTRESLLATDLTGLSGRTVNSLVLHNANATATTRSLTGTGAGQSLAVTSGAVLFTLNTAAAAGNYGLQLGGFDSGITVGGTNEYVIHVVNPSSASTTPVLTATIASPLTSAADITKSGRGTLILSAANTAGGGANKTTLNEGILEISDLDNIGGNTGNLVFAGGTLRLGSAFDVNTDVLSTRSVTFLNGGGTLDTNGKDPVLAGSLGSGVGSFTKAGAGNLTLNATSTRTGTTTVTGGTITIGATNALGVGGDLTLGAGTTLDIGSNSLSHGLVTTTGASPAILGAGIISASNGFFFNHTGDTSIGAVLAGAGGLLKAQANILTLTGASTYTGTTEIQAGTLSFTSIANVGAGASALGNPANAEAGIIRMGLTTAATTLNYTGSGHSSNRVIGMQGTTGNVTLDADGTGALVLTGGARFEMAGNKTLILRGSSDPAIENAISSLSEFGGVLTLNKADSNTWLINGINTYTGATQVDDGTLRIGLDNALPTATAVRLGSGATAGVLDLNGFDQTIASLTSATNSTTLTNSIIVDTGKTLTVTGAVTIGANVAAGATTLLTATGGGSFVNNNTGGTFQIGGATGGTNTNSATVDFSGLSNFTVNLGNTGTFRVGDNNTNASGSPASASTLILASTSATITAGTLSIGQGTGQGNAVQTLSLGAGTNTINADIINIGGNTTRSGGALNFAGAAGTVFIRGADGSSSTTVNMVNGAVNTAIANNTSFLLAGHSADVQISTMTMAAKSASTGPTTATFTFDTGTLGITTLDMVKNTGAYGGTATANVTLGGGTTTLGTVNMALNSSSVASTAAATLNVSGGAVTIGTGSGTAINMANAATGRTSTANINLTGGTVSLTGNIIRTGGAGTETATVTLDGSALNMSGNSIGTAGQAIVFNAQSGSLVGLNELNGGGLLTKTTTGVLSLGNGNAYTGGTAVTTGTLFAMNTIGSATGTGAITVSSGAILGGTGIIQPGSGKAITVDGTLQVGGPSPTIGQTLTVATDAAALTINSLLTLDVFSGQGSGIFNGLADADRLLLTGNTNAATVILGASSVLKINTPITSGWAANSSWKLIDWAGLTPTGTFSNITPGIGNFADLPDLSGFGLAWDLSSIYTTGVVSIAVVPEPSRMMLMLLGLFGLFLRRRRD